MPPFIDRQALVDKSNDRWPWDSAVSHDYGSQAVSDKGLNTNRILCTKNGVAPDVIRKLSVPTKRLNVTGCAPVLALGGPASWAKVGDPSYGVSPWAHGEFINASWYVSPTP